MIKSGVPHQDKNAACGRGAGLRRQADQYRSAVSGRRLSKLLDVKPDVILDEGGDEVIAVVVALVAAQRQRLTCLGAGGFENLGIQLFGQELIGLALIDQDAAGKGWRSRAISADAS